jgi:hypothetical protein
MRQHSIQSLMREYIMTMSTDDECCSRSSNVAIAHEVTSGADAMLVGRRQVARKRGCLNDVGGVKILVWSSSLPVVGSAKAWYET